MFDLTGKIAVVTGAASGIGASIAECYAHAGAHVFVTDRDAAAGQETASRIGESGGKADFVPEVDALRVVRYLPNSMLHDDFFWRPH